MICELIVKQFIKYVREKDERSTASDTYHE